MLHALFIGVDRYADRHVGGLRCARQDAEEFASFLSDHLETDRQITLLLDERATKARVRRVLTEELPRGLSAEDVVLFYFAGFGAAEIDPATNDVSTHLVLHDTELARLRQTSIDLRIELADWLRRLCVRSVAVMFDASFNGGRGGRSLEGPGLRSGPRQRPERFSLVRIPFPDKCGVLAAAADNEVANEDESLGHGVFTQHLLETLLRTSTKHTTSTLTSIRNEVLVRMNKAGITDQHPALYGPQGHGSHGMLFRLRESSRPPERLSSLRPNLPPSSS